MRKNVIVLCIVCLLIPAVVIAQQSVGISEAGFLTSMPPDAPLLNSPADEATLLADTVLVIWHAKIHTADYIRCRYPAQPIFPNFWSVKPVQILLSL